MTDFLGIHLLMGLIRLPAIEDYWSDKLRIENKCPEIDLKR